MSLKKDDKEKNVGVVKINLVEYLDGSHSRTIVLDKCPDKEAHIKFTLKSTLINNMGGGSETQSMISCDMSLDDEPQSEYDFGELNQPKEAPARARVSSV